MAINYNGTEIDKIVFNGVEVFGGTTMTVLGEEFKQYDVSGYKLIVVSVAIFDDDNYAREVNIISGESTLLYYKSQGPSMDDLFVKVFQIESPQATLEVRIGGNGADKKYTTVLGIK